MTASEGNGPLPLGVEIALHCFVAALVRDRLAVGGEGGSGGEYKS
jgi:hypothetical protein